MALNIDNRTIKVGAASVIASSTKQVADTWKYTFDFSDWLEAADTVLSATVAVSPAGPTVSVSSLSPNAVKVLVSGGTSGTKYTVTLQATTAGGQVKETELSLLVLNFPT